MTSNFCPVCLLPKKSYNLAHDIIIQGPPNEHPLLRVSTASIHLHADFGSYEQIETWIFSRLDGFRSRQIIHDSKEKALKAHTHIVGNLKTLPRLKGATRKDA